MATNLRSGSNKIVFYFAVIMSIGINCNGNQCFKPATDVPLSDNLRMNTDSFLTRPSLGPVDCVRTCKLHSLCNFVNYNKHTLDCSLLAINGDLVSDYDHIHIAVIKWNDNMLDGCKHHQCPNNTMCKANDHVGYECQTIGCNAIYVNNINHTSFSRKPLWNFGETVEYACTRGYFTADNATCLTSGMWSSFTCQRYLQCGDNDVCSVVENKHYWIYFNETQKLHKIYCDNGASLTLLEYNTATTPAVIRGVGSCALIFDIMKGQGYTDFQKVRLKLFPVHIKTYLLPFTNSTYTPQYYGHATDCYAGNNSHECGVLGKFIINTQGTGLRIKPSINWKTYGFNGVIANITRSYDGNYIEGYCGGQCGGCEPDGKLYLEADPNYTPPFESAELPICRYPHGL
ncbi:hypothetical protein LOTGIDRAFT_172515 [Lottia gigantea]|uniref:GON domain-containing protein n=1 Tax=Lottia gigantea TaxID=225164 RepID=V4B238_LOTGI|nr:hypothetical protein LOTGIDRAFT_172515 [Lottia gigantea]ESP01666.1 hypothetical protein LOTGIDRAFT_172515 [Lottia gigantea]